MKSFVWDILAETEIKSKQQTQAQRFWNITYAIAGRPIAVTWIFDRWQKVLRRKITSNRCSKETTETSFLSIRKNSLFTYQCLSTRTINKVQVLTPTVLITRRLDRKVLKISRNLSLEKFCNVSQFFTKTDKNEKQAKISFNGLITQHG